MITLFDKQYNKDTINEMVDDMDALFDQEIFDDLIDEQGYLKSGNIRVVLEFYPDEDQDKNESVA